MCVCVCICTYLFLSLNACLSSTNGVGDSVGSSAMSIGAVNVGVAVAERIMCSEGEELSALGDANNNNNKFNKRG